MFSCFSKSLSPRDCCAKEKKCLQKCTFQWYYCPCCNSLRTIPHNHFKVWLEAEFRVNEQKSPRLKDFRTINILILGHHACCLLICHRSRFYHRRYFRNTYLNTLRLKKGIHIGVAPNKRTKLISITRELKQITTLTSTFILILLIFIIDAGIIGICCLRFSRWPLNFSFHIFPLFIHCFFIYTEDQTILIFAVVSCPELRLTLDFSLWSYHKIPLVTRSFLYLLNSHRITTDLILLPSFWVVILLSPCILMLIL